MGLRLEAVDGRGFPAEKKLPLLDIRKGALTCSLSADRGSWRSSASRPTAKGCSSAQTCAHRRRPPLRAGGTQWVRERRGWSCERGGARGRRDFVLGAAWSQSSFLSKGKTTLLKHIANRALGIPPSIGVLLCEQGEAAGGRGAGEGNSGTCEGLPLGSAGSQEAERACGCELEGFVGRLGTGEMGATEVGGGAVRGWNKC